MPYVYKAKTLLNHDMPKARKEKFREGREKFKTKHGVFDDFTNRTIFKLITEGHFRGLESPINIGKESNVFIARKNNKKIIGNYRWVKDNTAKN